MITITTDAGEVRSVRGLLFDMDGTMVDSMAVTERTWNAWAASNGVRDRFRILHGRPAADTVRHSFPDADDDTIAALTLAQSRSEHLDLDGIRPMPGATALLTWLDRIAVPWAIVTSADTVLATARLEAAGIAAPVLVSCDDVTRGKPDPEPYLMGAALISVGIDECMVVEDAPAGLDSGLASGAVTAALNGLPGHVRIADLSDLHRLLRHGLTD